MTMPIDGQAEVMRLLHAERWKIGTLRHALERLGTSAHAGRTELPGLALDRVSAREEAVQLVPLIEAEETERCRRSLERRIARAALGVFKPVVDFDWTHPRKIDRDAVEALFDLDCLREHINVVFIGSGGVGKTMLAQNLEARRVIADMSRATL